jgi:predicted nucleic acid-binding Zn ribbon protein
MDKYVDEDELLRGAVSWQWRKKNRTSSIAESGRQFLGYNLRRLKNSAKIVDAWQELLPEEMKEHCSILKIENGVIEVEVDSGSFMHEMRLMSNELVEHLREICGQGKVKRIKLVAKGRD